MTRSVRWSVGQSSSIFHNFRRAREFKLTCSSRRMYDDIGGGGGWRKSGMGKGQGQYVVGDGETKRG